MAQTNENNSKLIFGTVILAAAIIGTGLYLGARGDAAANNRHVSVSGECLSTVKQDMTAITIRFTAIDKNPSVSMARARGSYEAMSKRIRDITDSTIKMNTTRFDSYEKEEWNHNENRSVKIGTETNIELEISSENRNTIETIIALADGAEYTEVQGLRMFTSPAVMKVALDDCIKTAVENAREKASAIAGADGRRIGKMVSAEYSRTVGGGGGIRAPMMKMAMYNAASYDMATGATELYSADSDISVTVNTEFEIK